MGHHSPCTAGLPQTCPPQWLCPLEASSSPPALQGFSYHALCGDNTHRGPSPGCVVRCLCQDQVSVSPASSARKAEGVLSVLDMVAEAASDSSSR